MPYLIDGHNLIGQLPDISLTDPNDEAKLVTKLRGFAALSGKTCHVIFDHGLPGGKSKLSNGKVKVVFASQPGDADTIMLKRIQAIRDVKGWIVVSSDQRVLGAARQRGMRGVRSTDFARDMQRRTTTPTQEKNPNVYVSPAEVDEWVKLFTDGE
jgi:uncharacterized protein